MERHHLFVDPDHFLDPEGVQLKGTFIKIAGMFNGVSPMVIDGKIDSVKNAGNCSYILWSVKERKKTDGNTTDESVKAFNDVLKGFQGGAIFLDDNIDEYKQELHRSGHYGEKNYIDAKKWDDIKILVIGVHIGTA